MKYTYTPKGVCSQKFELELENNIIKKLTITGGCPGNTMAVCKLVEGQTLDWAIQRLKGIDCRGRGTSCADQVAQFFGSIKK
ncbi:MAG: TIGR03905 family TSCPD domain-containing protein [Mycoplasmoidaceae bacterium]